MNEQYTMISANILTFLRFKHCQMKIVQNTTICTRIVNYCTKYSREINNILQATLKYYYYYYIL